MNCSACRKSEIGQLYKKISSQRHVNYLSNRSVKGSIEEVKKEFPLTNMKVTYGVGSEVDRVVLSLDEAQSLRLWFIKSFGFIHADDADCDECKRLSQKWIAPVVTQNCPI